MTQTMTMTFKLSKDQFETGIKLVLERLKVGCVVDFESVYRHIADNLPHRLMVRGMERRELAREITTDTLKHLKNTGRIIETLIAAGSNEPGMLQSYYQYRLANPGEFKTFEEIQNKKERLTAKLGELTQLLKRFGVTGIAFEDPVGIQGVILKSEDDIDGLLTLLRRNM